MRYNGLLIRSLYFSGANLENVGIDFDPGVNLIYGASNTGKSFALKAIDFVLGSSSKLPGIDERKGYETVWLELDIVGEYQGLFSLSRSINGGDITLYERSKSNKVGLTKVDILDHDHDDKKDNNISQFLLKRIGLKGKIVAKNMDGEKGGLSFRDMAVISFVDEKAIQNDKSPVMRVSHSKPTRERRVFRTILTGEDDSMASSVVPQKRFKVLKDGKLELLDEIVAALDSKINNGGYSEEPTSEKIDDIENEILMLNRSMSLAQDPIKNMIDKKSSMSSSLMEDTSRLDQVNAHIYRFRKLDEVYISDIERLKSIEESGFLLSKLPDKDCPLCGAAYDAQSHKGAIVEVNKIRDASIVEKNKIENLRKDLSNAIDELIEEGGALENNIDSLKINLIKIENDMQKLMPNISELQSKIDSAYSMKEHLTKGMSLFERRNDLIKRREEIERSKSASKKDKPKLEHPALQLREFCNDVGGVLAAWGFPGGGSVSFDDDNYDIRIGSKLRTDNGKGVRAVTHAAFKVALLIYCRRNNLPHPGVIILDTPLVTYRDPLKSKYGELSEDEKDLASTPLKDKFFKHLYSLSHLGQFIVFDNIDPPTDIKMYAKVHEFSGAKNNGRYGLFPV